MVGEILMSFLKGPSPPGVGEAGLPGGPRLPEVGQPRLSSVPEMAEPRPSPGERLVPLMDCPPPRLQGASL